MAELLGLRAADNYLLNACMGRQDIISLCVYYDLYDDAFACERRSANQPTNRPTCSKISVSNLSVLKLTNKSSYEAAASRANPTLNE